MISARLKKYRLMLTKPKGKPCGAGGNYFYIAYTGDVFPCGTYAGATASGLFDARLGSVLDPGFQLSPQPGFQPCISPVRCGCPEDYQNLTEIQSRFTWPQPSFCLPVEKEI